MTKVVLLEGFNPAEVDHPNDAALNPHRPYILFHNAPKVEHLKQAFPEPDMGKETGVALPIWGDSCKIWVYSTSSDLIWEQQSDGTTM